MHSTDDFSKQVYDQLVLLNTRFNSLQTDFHSLKSDFHRMDKVITGAGDPDHSLVVQVDRLAQESTRRTTWVKACVGASVAAVFGFVGMLVKLVVK